MTSVWGNNFGHFEEAGGCFFLVVRKKYSDSLGIYVLRPPQFVCLFFFNGWTIDWTIATP